MEVVYEDNHFIFRKSLIFKHTTDYQRLIKKPPKPHYLQNCCRSIVGSPGTNRFVVGKNMVVYEA